MAIKTAKQTKKVLDLSEYAEEAIPFEEVIRVLGKTKTTHTKKIPASKAAKATKLHKK